MKHILLIIYVLLFSACSIKHEINRTTINENQEEVIRLANMIQELSEKIDKKESQNIASEAIFYSKKLANEYGVITTPLLHNTLINLNIKEKGYCYHYANDLMAHLKKKEYKNIKLFRVVASRGEYFEHGSLIMTSHDVKFEDSILLDAWRNSGKLFFSKVKDDKKYKWELR